jgi:predicted TIM-barrel fold metal-dependent hydrolase
MEAALELDVEALTAAFGAFNQWLDEDWGFNHEGRIYAAPYFTLTDVDWAVRELDRVLEAGATCILMRPGSVLTSRGRVTPGHERHDPFWSKVDAAGITVVLHGGDYSYQAYEQLWGLTGETEAFRVPTLKRLLSASGIRDTMASMFADNLFDRFPHLRIATIETGSDWVSGLLKKLGSVHVQIKGAFRSDPLERFNQNVWVSPFFEDDVLGLIGRVGADRVVFGSDWPHVEGLAEPASFADELPGVSAADVKRIMHDNARALVTPLA